MGIDSFEKSTGDINEKQFTFVPITIGLLKCMIYSSYLAVRFVFGSKGLILAAISYPDNYW